MRVADRLGKAPGNSAGTERLDNRSKAFLDGQATASLGGGKAERLEASLDCGISEYTL